MLARIYRDGHGGTPVDSERAEELYRAAAEDDDSDAMYSLARLLQGRGGAANLVEAVDWYRKSSEAGDSDADYALALAYTDGKGIVRNDDRAAHFLVQAIARGSDFVVTEMKGNHAAWPRTVLRAVQEHLRDRGHYRGPIDGRFGPGTLRAIDALAATAR